MTRTSVTTVDEGDGAIVVRITGDIDIVSAELVGRAIASAIGGSGIRCVTVDLAGVMFLGASGIHVLVASRMEADERGVRVRVANPNNNVRRTLYLAGVLEWLTAYPNEP